MQIVLLMFVICRINDSECTLTGSKGQGDDRQSQGKGRSQDELSGFSFSDHSHIPQGCVGG